MLPAADAAQVLRFQSFLLADESRLDTWRGAIQAEVRPGDVVLDLGAGMGILSLFACDAGAARVYAVEGAPSLELARLVAADNGLAERIVCLRGRSQELDLPEPATVLITDTTETFGLNGQLVSSVIDARDRLLAPGARLLPRALELRCAPIEAPDAFRYLVDVWRSGTLGFEFGALRSYAANCSQPSQFGADAFLAEPGTLGRVELATAASPAFSGRTRVTVSREGSMDAVGGFFAAELSDGIAITNDPREPTVTYNRTLLPLAEPLPVRNGDELEVTVDSYDGREWRWTVERSRAGEPLERRQHATLHAFPRTRTELLGASPAATPARSRRGEAELFALGALDGRRTLGDIAAELQERFGDVVRSDPEAAMLLRELVTRCADPAPRAPATPASR